VDILVLLVDGVVLVLLLTSEAKCDTGAVGDKRVLMIKPKAMAKKIRSV
jgi:hypothetical protein